MFDLRESMQQGSSCHGAASVIVDPGIGTLENVLEMTESDLRQYLPNHRGPLQDMRIHVLKHHKGSRCTLEIGFRTSGKWHSVIAKVYAADRSDVFRAMKQLRMGGFGPTDECSTPEPLAYISNLHLLLLENVPGPRAKQILLSDDPADRKQVAQRCARWLARFHTAALRFGQLFDPAKHLDSIERWSQRVAALGQDCARQASMLCQGLIHAAAGLKATTPCAGHGSFSCNQIILSGNRTVTFDWDGYDMADPSRDVARFVVALQRLGIKYRRSIHAFDEAADVFLSTYQAVNPRDVQPNLPFYRALTCLRLAKYEANRETCILREGIEGLLSEGLRVLQL